MSQTNSLVQYILDNNNTADLQKPAIHTELAAYINQLILDNFDDLVYLLYRIDVSEQKLKKLLKDNSKEDAGMMIATMVIERQLQKIRSRQEYRRDQNIVDDEEKW